MIDLEDEPPSMDPEMFHARKDFVFVEVRVSGRKLDAIAVAAVPRS